MLLSNAATQSITHWSKGTPDGYGGVSYSSPTVLNGRWEDRIETIITAAGESTTSKAVVYLSVDVALGDYLFLGASSVADPTTLVGAYEVISIRKIPSIDGRRFERKVYL